MNGMQTADAIRTTEDQNNITRHGLEPFKLPDASDYFQKDSGQMYFSEKRHLQRNPKSNSDSKAELDWRNRDRMKTSAVALAVCLNAGVDPPDITKTSPCARLECWLDPLGFQEPKKAVEQVTKQLWAQYEVWQPRARYKVAPDPTPEDLKRMCALSRRSAKEERVLFHYTGHGVPKPTPSGEIWVFNKEFTQYIPVSLHDVQQWLGVPTILVLDCSAAENIINAWNRFAEQKEKDPLAAAFGGGADSIIQAMTLKDCVHLAACRSNEQLPTDPKCPADIFSCCLTTPIETALRWFVQQNPVLCANLDPDSVLSLPGKLTDRRSPLGEMNWVFTAVTDTIAWNMLSHNVFKRLFRQDMMMAALFRNFLLAQRIMQVYGCHPVSYPEIPDATNHEMWQAWDTAVDFCLSQFPEMLAAQKEGRDVVYQHSSFFADQLEAFKVWLDRGSVSGGSSPPQLPVVLQVLLSQVHRKRALLLLSQFLDLGPWAVQQALAVGIFTYVTKLLQAPAVDLKPILIFIWGKIIAVEPECQQVLLKDEGYAYFLNLLLGITPGVSMQNQLQSIGSAEHRAICAFVLSRFCRNQPEAQKVCLSSGLLNACTNHLKDEDPLLRQWCCICFAELWRGFNEAKLLAVREGIIDFLVRTLSDNICEVRAAVLFAMTSWISNMENNEQAVSIMQNLILAAIKLRMDGSTLVRRELVGFLSAVVSLNPNTFSKTAATFIDEEIKREEELQHGFRGKPSTEKQPVTIESIAWRTLLLLSVDPFPEIASLAGFVVDWVHRKMWDLPLGELMHQIVNLQEPLAPPSATKRPASFSGRENISTPPPLLIPPPGLMDEDSFSEFGKPLLTPGFERRPASVSASSRITTTLKRSATGTIMTLKNLYFGNSGPTQSSITGSSSGTSIDHLQYPQIPPYTGNHQTGQYRYLRRTQSSERNPKIRKARRRSFSIEKSTSSLRPQPELARIGSERMLRELVGSSGLPRGRERRIGEQTRESEPSFAEKTKMPIETKFLDYCAEYFKESQIHHKEEDEPGSIKYNERVWRRERNDLILREAHATFRQITKSPFDVQRDEFLSEQFKPSLVRFETYENRLVLCNRKQYISVWDWTNERDINYEVTSSQTPIVPQLLNSFMNLNPQGSQITSIKFINEEDTPLMLVGSGDGIARIYRDYTEPKKAQLVTSWHALTSLQQSSFGSGLVLDWYQEQGVLLCSGDAKYIRIWDAESEKCIGEIPTEADSCVTSLTGDHQSGIMCIAGFGDGTIRIFDRRLPARQCMVGAKTEHSEWILGVHMQRGGTRELISGSSEGTVKLWDIRQEASISTINAEPSDTNMLAFAVHDFSPVFATFSGELLNTVSAYTGILGQRLAPVADLAMHPLKGVLAYGGIDGTVVLFESNVQRKSRTGLYREEGRSEYLAEGGVYQPLKVPDL